ncbi:hypothetical protein pVco5_035 [Vibrio phage pVco-5]|uniref:Uncharacterized protein n=1 Tax=Vibrio phage pVco-5 TaxID=1965485 RepID=A0A1W6JUR7_9CAUD|nr:hypothetical protein KNT61_gp035 [Vibrio phage pVco-5]ARM71023.1 hypothetical protein pVco5_035 [Vibrio phage pVco-5]
MKLLEVYFTPAGTVRVIKLEPMNYMIGRLGLQHWGSANWKNYKRVTK